MKFKVSVWSFLSWLFFVNVTAFIAILIEDGDFSNFNIIVLFNAMFVSLMIFNKNILLIEFGEDKLEIKYFRFLIIKNESFKYIDIEFSYNRKLVSKGSVENELKIFFKGVKVLSLNPAFSVFKSENINDIVQALKNKNVLQID